VRATLPRARGVEAEPEMIPFDPQARSALERTFAEASALAADRIGAEHMLLAVLTVEDGTGVLAGSGVTHGAVTAHLGSGDRGS
jgi:predicted TIM-barrel enzyme